MKYYTEIDTQTGTVVKSFFKRVSGKGEFFSPIDICLDEQHRIVVTDSDNLRIQIITQESWSPSQPFLVSSRNDPRGSLRDETKNGCEGDYKRVRLLPCLETAVQS